MFERNRTRPFLICHALYLYFLGLGLRSTPKALEPFVDRSYVTIWYWIQAFDPKDIFPNKKKAEIAAFVIDETVVKIGGSTNLWLWVVVGLTHYRIIGVYLYFKAHLTLTTPVIDGLCRNNYMFHLCGRQ